MDDLELETVNGREADGKVVEKYLEAIYRKLNEDREWYSPDTIHVSDLVPECPRSVILGKLLQRDISLESALYMADGMSKHEIPLADKHEWKIEYGGIRGKVDDYDSIRGIIYEKKTTLVIPRQPRENHVRQLKYYAVLIRKLGYEVREGWILYLKRDMVLKSWDDMPTGFRIDLENFDDEEVWKEMIRKADEIKRMVRDRVLPPRKIGYYCRYCSFPETCFTTGEVL